MMAKWARARVIAVEIAANKFDACRKAGADAVVDPGNGNVVEALLDLTRGEGVDVVVDYVSSTLTLEAGAKALGRHGRLVTLGGAGQSFHASAMDMLNKEQDFLGSRYVTRTDIRRHATWSRAARFSRSLPMSAPWKRRRRGTHVWKGAKSLAGRHCVSLRLGCGVKHAG